MRLVPVVLLALAMTACSTAPPTPAKKAEAPAPDVMPDVYRVLFDTTQGSFIVEVHKDWAPKAAERFYMLSNTRFFNDTRFYRVRAGFIAQFGLSGDPQAQSMLNAMPLADEPRTQKNLKGTIAFAQAGERSRRTQVFVNLKDNPELDRAGFVPFGAILEGMPVFDKLYSGYGEWEPPGRGPNANRIQTEGNAYLEARFPRLDKILRAKVTR